jgi:hypothetical protein
MTESSSTPAPPNEPEDWYENVTREREGQGIQIIGGKPGTPKD